MPASQITTGYRRLVAGLGFDLGGPISMESRAGFYNAHDLRTNPQHSDRRFRYAAVLKAAKLGVTDVFELNGAPCIYFKSLASEATAEDIRMWHRTAWNHGLGRMLWIVTPSTIQVLNAYKPPEDAVGEGKHPAELLRAAIGDLERLREYELDRISLESGQFWDTTRGRQIKKSERIDTKLAEDLAKAGEILVQQGCASLAAHRLMLRTMFTAYLEARSVLPASLFEGLEANEFHEVLTSTKETRLFFERMRETFNGDLFPPPPKSREDEDTYTFAKKHLDVARRIVEREDLQSGQQSFDFWRYDFEVIPIELIIDGKNFFSQEKQSLLAQRSLYRAFATRELINLAALHDKGLFPSAKQPAIVFIAENTLPEATESLLFVSAERNESFRQHGILELNSENSHRLPLRKLESCPYLLKVATFGSARDLAIVERLQSEFGTLAEYLDEIGTGLRQGFIRGNQASEVPERIKQMPMLEGSELPRWLLSTTALPKMSYDHLEHARSASIYQAQLCLFKQSLQDDRLVASLSKSDVAYAVSYYGVSLGEASNWRAKFLASVFNSSLAMYCFFFTSTRFGIDKQIVMPNDLLRLPVRQPISQSECLALIREFDQRAKKGDDGDFESLDTAVFDYFEIDEWDREYIADVVKFDLEFARRGAKSVAVLPADEDGMIRYADSLLDAIRANLVDSDVIANIDVLGGLKDIRAVVVKFDETRKRDVKTTIDDQLVDGQRLANLLHAPITSSARSRRSLLMFDDEQCIVIKHAQRRFWSRARAQDDADSIFTGLLQPAG